MLDSGGGRKHVLIAAITLIKFVTVCSQRACWRGHFLPLFSHCLLWWEDGRERREKKAALWQASTRLLCLLLYLDQTTFAAHGFVSSITVGGTTYPGADPVWFYYAAGQAPVTAGWQALNQDNGFVEPAAYGTSDIACHKSAKSTATSIPVKAGDSLKLQWNTWPESHHGPVIDYLAKVSSHSTSTSAGSLSFFKIQQSGLINGANPPGTWASDNLMSAGNTWTVKIPTTLASGSYVLRHEIIALHSAGSSNGAQNYPQCINLVVTGTGSTVPAGTPATSLYKINDPGILVSIYGTLSSYTIPGPALSTIKKMARHVRDFATQA